MRDPLKMINLRDERMRTQAVNGDTCTSKGNCMVIVQLLVEALVITLILNLRLSDRE